MQSASPLCRDGARPGASSFSSSCSNKIRGAAGSGGSGSGSGAALLCRRRRAAPLRSRSAAPAQAAAETVKLPANLVITRAPLGASDLAVSSVALGTMTFGEQTAEPEAHRMLSLAADAGINFVDTAELYPVAPRRETAGLTSQIVGRWLSGRRRDEVVVASKVAGRAAGLEWIPANRTDPPGPAAPPVLDGPAVIAAAEAELRRLNTDWLDVLYLHWSDRYRPGFGRSQYRADQEWAYTPFSELVAAVGSLLEAGKVRYWALSNESSFGVCMYCMVADALGVERPIAIQNSYSLVHRSFEAELAEACSPRHFNLPLLPWSALAGGALSGKYLDEPPAGVARAGAEARFSCFPDRYARFNSHRVRRAVAEYAAIAAGCGVTPTHLAYAWAASRPFVGSTLVGATSAAQLADSLAFTGVELGRDVLDAIDAVHVRRRDPSLLD